MSGLERIALWGAVGATLLLDLALSTALAASSVLSRVTLRRMGLESGPRYAFLEDLQRQDSRQRAAASILRQGCLLVAVLGTAALARGSAATAPIALAVGGAALIAVLGIETLVARALAVWDPRRALRTTAFAVRLADVLLFPVVAPLDRLFAWVGLHRRISEEEREEEQEQQMEALIEVGEREGLFEPKEGEMLRGVVDLDETPVREIMTPRTDIVALPVETSVAEARRVLLAAGHSRLPVYRESLDNVVGILHSRDLFRAWEEQVEGATVAAYLRAPSFVPESRSAAALLADMRQTTHLAIVVDEYGGTAGLVTLEDLLEEIVGDIRDEHEEAGDEQWVREEAEGTFVIDAMTHVEELERLFGVEFEEREFDTVGGLVVFAFGRVPSAGEVAQTNGLRLEVLKADRRRVYRVRVRLAVRRDDVQVAR